MERRKFVKYSSLAGIVAGLFPLTSIQAMSIRSTSHLMKFASVSTQIRHGALNIPFASSLLKDELPFQWVLDVHQNIFLKDGFQRNVEEDMNVISIALKEESHYDALQINNSGKQISFLWKEQWLNCERGLPIRELDIQDDNYTFHLGHIGKSESFVFNQKPKIDYFVQVLDGQIQNESNILNSESGLGLISDISIQQSFFALEESNFLIIGCQNKLKH